MAYRIGKYLVIALSVMSAAMFCNCSSPNMADGGTHVGNPELFACSRLAFDAMAPGSLWQVESHVPGGFERLDSAGILLGPGTPGGPIVAKRRVARGDTLVDSVLYITDTLYTDDTIPVTDTIVRNDTTYLYDTLVEVRSKIDTTDTIVGTDTTTIISEKTVRDTTVVVDTLFAIDTIVYRDTVFLRDTVLIRDTIRVSSDNITRGETASSDSAIAPSSGYIVPSAPDSYTGDGSTEYLSDSHEYSQDYRTPQYTIDDGSVASVTKYYSVGGVQGQETFIDLDGDGRLLSAGTGMPMLRYVNSGSGASERLYAVVDFDAGEDRSFATVDDNRISYLLAERRAESGYTIAVYAPDSARQSGDTITLVYDNYTTADSLQSIATSYKLLRGEDYLSHRSDRLVAIERSVLYRSGHIARIDMAITLNAALMEGESDPTRGSIDATIELRDGTIGILQAAIYSDLEFLDGTYMKGCYDTTGTCREKDIEFDLSDR